MACARCPTLATTTDLARGFARLVRERRGEQFPNWVEKAQACNVPELRSFASGLRKDWYAVTAGLTLHWNSGPVEGHINRIKMIKRQMYGANVALLPRLSATVES